MSVQFGDSVINPNIEEPVLDVSISKPSIQVNFNAPSISPKGGGNILRELVNPQFFIGTVTTLQPGEDVYCYLTGTKDAPVLNFGIPMGYTGANGQDGADGNDGITPTTTVTSITGGHNVAFDYGVSDPRNTDFDVMDGTNGTNGVSPAVTIASITGGHTVKITDADHPTGQTFNVMDGTAGAAATIAVGTVTTGQPTDPASVTNTGTSSAAVFDFTIPKGEKGDTGATGTTLLYGTCSTGASTAAKEVTITGVTALTTGLTILVKFTNSNSKADPTLKVNSLSAVAIKRYGTTAPSTSAASSWNAGAVIALTYDGTYWVMHDWNNTTYSAMTEAEMQTGTSTTARTITPARLAAAVAYHAPVTDVTVGGTSAVTSGVAAVPSFTTAFTVTLSSASWISNQQTVSDAKFIASGYAYMVSPASSGFSAYTDAEIYADDVSTDGSMTFHCTTAPSSNLTVNIVRVVA